MVRHQLIGEELTALPERLETALVTVVAAPSINVNVANVTVPQINTGVQISVLGASPQALLQGNVAGAVLGQTN